MSILNMEFRMPTARDWAEADPNVAYWLCAQAGQNVLCEGEPGVAKTQSVIRMSELMGREALILLGSTMAPEDVGGIPHVMTAEQFFRQIPPYWAHRLSEPGVNLFCDEFTTVTPSVRAPLLTMYSDRRIGQLRIHPSNLMLAACNPPIWAPNGSPLEKAMANRFSHFKWNFNFEGFSNGMESPEDTFTFGYIPTLPEGWGDLKPKWGHLITGYLRKNSNERVVVPQSEDEKAYPTPRTWHALRNCLAAADAIGAPANIQLEIAQATVGRVSGGNFMRHVAQVDLADPEAVLAGTVTFKFDRKRVDAAAALLVSIVSCIRQKYTEERMIRAVDVFCNNIGQHAKELVFTHLRSLASAKPTNEKMPTEAVKIIGEFGKTIPEHVKRQIKK